MHLLADKPPRHALGYRGRHSNQINWRKKRSIVSQGKYSTKDMDTEIFKKKFNAGELGDDKEWIEWEHFANVVSLLQKKIIDLETLKYEI